LHGAEEVGVVDPADNSVFYVGKGRGKPSVRSIMSPLLTPTTEPEWVRRSSSTRFGRFEAEVVRFSVIVRHGLDDKTALEIEAVLIEEQPRAHPELIANLVSGHHRERGKMSADEWFRCTSGAATRATSGALRDRRWQIDNRATIWQHDGPYGHQVCEQRIARLLVSEIHRAQTRSTVNDQSLHHPSSASQHLRKTRSRDRDLIPACERAAVLGIACNE